MHVYQTTGRAGEQVDVAICHARSGCRHHFASAWEPRFISQVRFEVSRLESYRESLVTRFPQMQNHCNGKFCLYTVRQGLAGVFCFA
jgi:hypothetical protein